jgi:methyltransferase (TIGR00027 family)
MNGADRTGPINTIATVEEKMTAAMAEYNALKDADENDLDFINKTAMWIAYERHVESQRTDGLFHDPLAPFFMEPYGKRLSDAMSMGLALTVFDPPGSEIGFGLEGHVMYTAARTKLINDQLDHWLLNDNTKRKDNDSKERYNQQVVNLGAGMDTRPYWLESLKSSKGNTLYWDIDTASIMNHKQKILEELKKEKGDQVAQPLCQIKAIAMDFSKESITEILPLKHDFQRSVPTCWILEGLIMYLQHANVEELLDEISDLSCSGSFLILNFSNNDPQGPTIDEIDKQLVETKGEWIKQQKLMFGEDGFNFDRYPANKPANPQLGFAMYSKK